MDGFVTGDADWVSSITHSLGTFLGRFVSQVQLQYLQVFPFLHSFLITKNWAAESADLTMRHKLALVRVALALRLQVDVVFADWTNW